MYERPQPQPRKDAPSPLRLLWAYRAVLAVLALSMLLVGGPQRAQALLRCEITQTLHEACCCPASLPAVASVLRAARSGCCTRVEVDRGLPSSLLAAQTQVAPPQLVALATPWRGFGSLPFLLPLAGSARQQLWRLAPLPIRSRPSLIVLHRRFLI